MVYRVLRSLALISLVSLSTTASAESHVAQSDDGAVRYGSDACNNDPEYLSANNITCSAVFSTTNVADFIGSLTRSMPLSMFAELNPRLGPIDRDTALEGILILRIR